MFNFFYDNFFSNPFEETCFSWGGKADSAFKAEGGKGMQMEEDCLCKYIFR